jgi:hypothetical protein
MRHKTETAATKIMRATFTAVIALSGLTIVVLFAALAAFLIMNAVNLAAH